MLVLETESFLCDDGKVIVISLTRKFKYHPEWNRFTTINLQITLGLNKTLASNRCNLSPSPNMTWIGALRKIQTKAYFASWCIFLLLSTGRFYQCRAGYLYWINVVDIIRSPKWQWSNPEEHGYLDHVRPLQTDEITSTKQSSHILYKKVWDNTIQV